MDAADLPAEGCRIIHRFDEILVQFGIDPSRRDGVTADPVAAMVDGNGTGQPVKSGL